MTRTDEQVRLVVHVDPAVDPIGGHVDDGAVRRPFAGWLQLLAAVEALRRPAEADVALPAQGEVRW